MSSPRIPETLTLDACIGVEHEMIYHDPDHRKNTRAHFGHEPTPADLARHWFETDAHSRLHEVFDETARKRATMTASTV